jgi:hypothetical protein
MLLQSESLEMEYFQKKLDITKPTELRFVENSSGEQVLLNWVECGAWAQAGYSPNESHPKRERKSELS